MDPGSLADWVAAIGTTAAFGATMAIFATTQHRESRKQADDIHSSLGMHVSISIVENMPVSDVDQVGYKSNDSTQASSTKVIVHVINHSPSPISLPEIYIPDQKKRGGWLYGWLLEDEILYLNSGEEVKKSFPILSSDVRDKIMIRFRDARNRYWLRYIDSGQYPRWPRRWLIKRALKNSVPIQER